MGRAKGDDQLMLTAVDETYRRSSDARGCFLQVLVLTAGGLSEDFQMIMQLLSALFFLVWEQAFFDLFGEVLEQIRL